MDGMTNCTSLPDGYDKPVLACLSDHLATYASQSKLDELKRMRDQLTHKADALAAADKKAAEAGRRIAQMLNGRRLADLTVGEWDHVLTFVDMHIEACDVRIAARGVGGYAYGPTTRAKFENYRRRAAREAHPRDGRRVMTITPTQAAAVELTHKIMCMTARLETVSTDHMWREAQNVIDAWWRDLEWIVGHELLSINADGSLRVGARLSDNA